MNSLENRILVKYNPKCATKNSSAELNSSKNHSNKTALMKSIGKMNHFAISHIENLSSISV